MATRLKQGGDYCSAVSCSNARYKKNCVGKSFFSFPKDEERCKRWVLNCGREDLMNIPVAVLHSRKYVFCEDHFEDGQFQQQEERNRLIWNAVPTLFAVPNPPPPVTTKRPYREKHSPPDLHPKKQRRKSDKEGKPSELFDISNPDWAPTLNLGHGEVTAVPANRDGTRHKRGINRKSRKKLKCNNKLNMDTMEKAEDCSEGSNTLFSSSVPEPDHCDEGQTLTVKFEVEDQPADLQQESHSGNECDTDSVHSASQLSDSGVFIDDAEVIQLWRLIGDWQELNTDLEIARFLLSLNWLIFFQATLQTKTPALLLQTVQCSQSK